MFLPSCAIISATRIDGYQNSRACQAAARYDLFHGRFGKHAPAVSRLFRQLFRERKGHQRFQARARRLTDEELALEIGLDQIEWVLARSNPTV